MAEIVKLVADVPGVRAFPVTPNSLGIRGAGNGLQFAVIGSNSYAELGDAANRIIAEMEKDPRFQQPRLSTDATQPQLSVVDRPRPRLRPRHRHHRPLGSHAGDARRQRGRRGVHRRPQLCGEAGLDHQSDQRSDRPREHLPEDGRRPLRAAFLDRHADREGGAAVAVARAAAAVGRHHHQPGAGLRARRRLRARTGDRRAAAAGRQPHPAACRGGDARRDQQRHADGLRLRARHHPARAGGAVRKLRQRRHHHGDGAARARLRRSSRCSSPAPASTPTARSASSCWSASWPRTAS